VIVEKSGGILGGGPAPKKSSKGGKGGRVKEREADYNLHGLHNCRYGGTSEQGEGGVGTRKGKGRGGVSTVGRAFRVEEKKKYRRERAVRGGGGVLGGAKKMDPPGKGRRIFPRM